MSREAQLTERLKERTHQAHIESGAFDFVREGEALATFYRQATPGTTYWRGYIPMRKLPGQVVPVEPDSLTENEDGTINMKHARGTLIWQFLGDDGRSRIATQLKRQGFPTFMEVDDNYLRFAPPQYGKISAWQRTHTEAMATGNGYSIEMHRKIVPTMDGIICATDALANEYDRLNDNVYVARNSIDPDDWDVERTESETLRIGYYGAPAHVRDWPRAKKALKWASMQDGVEVVMMGFSPPGWTGKKLPWADNLFDARRNLGQIDVGIAPLTRNPWADCKSDIKALEYAMAGAMPILQDAPPYSPWKDMGWEWMPKDEREWVDVIHDVVAMRDEVPLLAAEAKAYVLNNRTIDHEIHAWREAISA